MDYENFEKSEYLRLLGRHIARVRKSKGYSQDRLALEAGFSRGTMSKIEAGLADPKASTLERIAFTIEVPASRLLDIHKTRS